MLTNITRLGIVFAAMLALCVGAPTYAAIATLNSVIVVDPLSGVAIGGYDPVSYFTESEPLQGRPAIEYDWMGVPWYFANAANRDIFKRAPKVYAPQFGGHGTMGLARGYLSDGNPRIYVISGQRLFMFYSTGNRDAFLLAPRAAYEKAVENWNFLSQDLSRGPE